MNSGPRRRPVVDREAAAPCGFSLLRILNMRDGADFLELWLPTGLKDDLLEEQRAMWLKRVDEQRLKLDRALAQQTNVAGIPQRQSTTGIEADVAFSEAFDRRVGRRNRTRLHPVLTSKELIRVAEKVSSMRDRDYQRREREFLDKLKTKGALRAVANPIFSPASWTRSLDDLYRMHPHFRAVTGYVAKQVALSARSSRPLTIPPLHLWGMPGIGKSCYANALAKALGAPLRRHSMENAQTTALLLGSERHWSTAAPGIVFEEVVLGQHANPIFLIEELDKASRGATYDPTAPLHSLLEPLTAQKVRDASLDLEFDASLAIYIATSNDPTKVPAPLRSRFREFEILPLTGEEALRAARVVVASAIAELNVPGFTEPEPRLAHKLAHLTPREIHHAVRDAVATALESGRLYLTVDDLADEQASGECSPRVLH